MNIILFGLIPVGYPGGFEKYIASIALFFSNRGDNITIISSHQYRMLIRGIYKTISLGKLEWIGYVKRELGDSHVYSIGLAHILPFTKRNKHIKELLLTASSIYAKNDVFDLLCLYILLGPRQFNRKVIIGVHTAIFLPNNITGIWRLLHDILYTSLLYKMLLNNARNIHVPNSSYINILSKHFKINKKRIIHIPHPIDWNVSLSSNTDQKFKIIWVGRLTDQKGVDRLAKIISNLSNSPIFHFLEFTIAGQGPEIHKVSQLTSKYNNVNYIGYVKNMAKVYENADLSFSTSYFEMLPYSILEPQSYGIPVISFKIAGADDIITPVKTGYLVDTIDEYCEKVKKFYMKKKSNEKEYRTMQKNIYEITNAKFNRQMIYRKLELMFRRQEYVNF